MGRSVLVTFWRSDGIRHTYGATSYFRAFSNPARACPGPEKKPGPRAHARRKTDSYAMRARAGTADRRQSAERAPAGGLCVQIVFLGRTTWVAWRVFWNAVDALQRLLPRSTKYVWYLLPD